MGFRARPPKKRQDFDARWDKFLRSLPVEQRLAGISHEKLLAGISTEKRLAGIPPEKLLAGISAEKRLAGLPQERRLLAMPDEFLRALSDEYIGTLPRRVQRAIRERLG